MNGNLSIILFNVAFIADFNFIEEYDLNLSNIGLCPFRTFVQTVLPKSLYVTTAR